MADPVKPKIKTYTVAPRRELSHDGDGRRAPKNLVEGDTIDLEEDEGARLQELGFLVKDDGSAAVPTGGPAVVKGVDIKEVD